MPGAGIGGMATPVMAGGETAVLRDETPDSGSKPSGQPGSGVAATSLSAMRPSQGALIGPTYSVLTTTWSNHTVDCWVLMRKSGCDLA